MIILFEVITKFSQLKIVNKLRCISPILVGIGGGRESKRGVHFEVRDRPRRRNDETVRVGRIIPERNTDVVQPF